MGRLQVHFLLCQRSFQECSTLAACCRLPPQAESGVCTGKQQHPPPLPGCDTGSFAVGSSPQDGNLSFLSQFTSLLFLQDTQNSSCLDIFQCRGGAKDLTNSTGSEEGTEDRHHHCTVLPENILCSFRDPCISRISSDNLHITRK